MFVTSKDEIYQDGQIIFAEGSYSESVYAVKSGAVELSKTVDGKKVVIEILEAGYVFGELGFLAKVQRTATAMAVGETVIGHLDHETLDEDFNNLSLNFQAMLRSLALRLEKTTQLACGAASTLQVPR